MGRRLTPVVVVLAALLTASCTSGAAHAQLPLVAERDVALPGGTTRFDYQSIDTARHTLWIAHLGDSTVLAVNLDDPRGSEVVRDVADAHGVLAVPTRGRVYATATGTDEVVAIDAATRRVVARAGTGHFPDGLAYDPDHDVVLVSNKNDGAVTVHDAGTLATIRTVRIAKETGNVAYDPVAHMAYVAALPPDRIVAFDPMSGHTTKQVELKGCDGAHGVYLQPRELRAFVACENNDRLLTVDLHAGTVIDEARVGAGPDVLAYDSGLQLLYVASEAGTVQVFDVRTRRPRDVGHGKLHEGAHTVAVDPATHRVYFPLVSVDGHPTLRIMRPRGS